MRGSILDPDFIKPIVKVFGETLENLNEDRILDTLGWR